jgi:hypothetical protein
MSRFRDTAGSELSHQRSATSSFRRAPSGARTSCMKEPCSDAEQTEHRRLSPSLRQGDPRGSRSNPIPDSLAALRSAEAPAQPSCPDEAGATPLRAYRTPRRLVVVCHPAGRRTVGQCARSHLPQPLQPRGAENAFPPCVQYTRLAPTDRLSAPTFVAPCPSASDAGSTSVPAASSRTPELSAASTSK